MGRRKTISDDILLEYAREVFTECGSLASTKEIARRAGVSEATLFQRFPTKAGLFFAAMVPPAIDVEAVVDLDGLGDDPRAALIEIAERMVAEFAARIPIVRRLLEHSQVSMNDVTDFLSQREQRPVARLTAALSDRLQLLQSRGMVKEHDSVAAARLFVSAIHNLVAFEMTDESNKKDIRDRLESYVNAIWTGLQPLDGAIKKGSKNG